MKFPAQLTYGAFRMRSATRRYLFCKTEEKPHFGDPSFDFMGYFGFGSGEFLNQQPAEFSSLRVRVVNTDHIDPADVLVIAAKRMLEPTDAFRGFFTQDGEHFTLLEEDPDGVQLLHLPELHWAYYTNIGGDRKIAVSHLKAMNRRHFLFETNEQQSVLLERYAQLAGSI